MEKWYAIRSNLNYKEYSEQNVRISCLYWLRIKEIGNHTTSYGNEYKIYSYDFFNKSKNLTIIGTGGWKLLSIIDPNPKHAFDNNFTVRICDPNKEIRNLYNFWKSEIEGVISVLEFLNEVSEFSSWENYDLYTQIKEMKKENDKYELMVASFKQTKFYIELIKKSNDNNLNDEIERKKLLQSLKRKGLTEEFFNTWILES